MGEVRLGVGLLDVMGVTMISSEKSKEDIVAHIFQLTMSNCKQIMIRSLFSAEHTNQKSIFVEYLGQYLVLHKENNLLQINLYKIN